MELHNCTTRKLVFENLRLDKHSYSTIENPKDFVKTKKNKKDSYLLNYIFVVGTISSNRTDSSESYLEPCNNSTDEVTDLPTTAAQSAPKDDSTYTIYTDHSQQNNNTYTIQKDLTTSKEYVLCIFK